VVLDVHRRQRRIGTQIFTQSTKEGYRNIPYLELGQYLCELLDNPAEYQLIMENYTSRVISRLAYGVPDYYAEVKQCSHNLLRTISPAAYLTNVVPGLKKLPYFMSPWKWAENKRYSSERVFFLNMMNRINEQMKAGKAVPSYMRQILGSLEKYGVDGIETSYIVGMIGIVGVLTTSSALMNYTLAMTLYPEWQKKLQDEIAEVCGDRMPRFTDSPKMPLLRAIVMELIRWRPITPTGQLSIIAMFSGDLL
jgi:cytochrome P450